MDIMGFIKLKASLSKTFHIQPSEIDSMPMWEFEIYIKLLNDMVEEENKSQQKEMDKYNVNDNAKMANPKNIQNYANPSKAFSSNQFKTFK